MNAPTTQNLRAASERIARHVIAENKAEGFYPLELCVGGYAGAFGGHGDGTWAGHVQSVVERRGWKLGTPIRWRGELFVSFRLRGPIFGTIRRGLRRTWPRRVTKWRPSGDRPTV